MFLAELEVGGQGEVSICIRNGHLRAMKQIPLRRKTVALTEERAVSGGNCRKLEL
jgi:hypothetical protein